VSAPAVLEAWMSLTVQIALLAAATLWIERHVVCEDAGDRLWAAFHVSALALTVLAWCGPHLRLLNSRPLANLAGREQLVGVEERLAAVAVALWTCGAAVGVTSLGLGIWQTVRFLRTAPPVDGITYQRLTANAGNACQSGATVELRVSDRAVSPFCWQISRPVVVVPAQLLDAPPDVARVILNHELSHLRLGHPLHLFLQRLVEIVHWYHPLVWVASRRASVQREILADGEAVGSRAEAVAYLKGLLYLSECQSISRGLSAGLGLRGAPSLIQLRAQRIADGKWARPPRRRGRLACAALAATATACSLVWLPVNALASTRSHWSPWPKWTASALHELGVSARDYEIDLHRVLPHEHPPHSPRR
jgi:bla regulator protein BlaR1